jgi:hypothetical protein
MQHIKLFEEFINEKARQFPSAHDIGDFVSFVPSAKQCKDRMIEREYRYGMIVKVSFSSAKVFYDILDDYYSEIFPDIDSSFIRGEQKIKELKEK